jgi:hypothetical protein
MVAFACGDLVLRLETEERRLPSSWEARQEAAMYATSDGDIVGFYSR